ncbi:hypothetical protein [Streptomyces sp. NPDC127197]|uniref:WXG100-like domain-containing protein n=1 Tax=Streptomyces sp. NPDC127197 TaxID=3345388 RepID=UPI0036434374
MAIELPPELRTFMLVVAGQPFPQANEDLVALSQAPYREMARQLREFSDMLRDTSEQTARALPPSIGRSFLAAIRPLFDDGGENHLLEFARQMESVADGRQRIGVNVVESKWSIFAELVRLLIEIKVLLLISYFTGGSAASQIPQATARSRVTLLTYLAMMLTRVQQYMGVLTGAADEAFQTLITRLALMAFGPQRNRPDGVDWNDVGQSAAFGAVAGGLGTFFGAATGGLRNLTPNPFRNGADRVFLDPPGGGLGPVNALPTGGGRPNRGPESHAVDAGEGFVVGGLSEAVAEVLVMGAFGHGFVWNWTTLWTAGTMSAAEGGAARGVEKFGAALRERFGLPTFNGIGSGRGNRNGSGTDADAGAGDSPGHTGSDDRLVRTGSGAVGGVTGDGGQVRSGATGSGRDHPSDGSRSVRSQGRTDTGAGSATNGTTGTGTRSGTAGTPGTGTGARGAEGSSDTGSGSASGRGPLSGLPGTTGSRDERDNLLRAPDEALYADTDTAADTDQGAVPSGVAYNGVSNTVPTSGDTTRPSSPGAPADPSRSTPGAPAPGVRTETPAAARPEGPTGTRTDTTSGARTESSPTRAEAPTTGSRPGSTSTRTGNNESPSTTSSTDEHGTTPTATDDDHATLTATDDTAGDAAVGIPPSASALSSPLAPATPRTVAPATWEVAGTDLPAAASATAATSPTRPGGRPASGTPDTGPTGRPDSASEDTAETADDLSAPTTVGLTSTPQATAPAAPEQTPGTPDTTTSTAPTVPTTAPDRSTPSTVPDTDGTPAEPPPPASSTVAARTDSPWTDLAERDREDLLNEFFLLQGKRPSRLDGLSREEITALVAQAYDDERIRSMDSQPLRHQADHLFASLHGDAFPMRGGAPSSRTPGGRGTAPATPPDWIKDWFRLTHHGSPHPRSTELRSVDEAVRRLQRDRRDERALRELLARIEVWRGHQGADRSLLDAVTALHDQASQSLRTMPPPDARTADLTAIRYAEAAEVFDRKLGAYLVRRPQSVDAVRTLAQDIWSLLGQYAPERLHLLGMPPTGSARSGSVRADIDTLEDVVAEGNLRELTALLFSSASSLALDGFIDPPTTSDFPWLTAERVWRRYATGSARAFPVDGFEPPVTEREFAAAGARDDDGREYVVWKRARDEMDLPFRAPLHQGGDRTGGLVATGSSGSLIIILETAHRLQLLLDTPVDMAELRLGLMGAMLVGGHHTAHELIRSSALWPHAAEHGFSYVDGWSRYRYLAPLTEAELRRDVAENGLFPDEIALGLPPRDAQDAATAPAGAPRPAGRDAPGGPTAVPRVDPDVLQDWRTDFEQARGFLNGLDARTRDALLGRARDLMARDHQPPVPPVEEDGDSPEAAYTRLHDDMIHLLAFTYGDLSSATDPNAAERLSALLAAEFNTHTTPGSRSAGESWPPVADTGRAIVRPDGPEAADASPPQDGDGTDRADDDRSDPGGSGGTVPAVTGADAHALSPEADLYHEVNLLVRRQAPGMGQVGAEDVARIHRDLADSGALTRLTVREVAGEVAARVLGQGRPGLRGGGNVSLRLDPDAADPLQRAWQAALGKEKRLDIVIDGDAVPVSELVDRVLDRIGASAYRSLITVPSDARPFRTGRHKLLLAYPQGQATRSLSFEVVLKQADRSATGSEAGPSRPPEATADVAATTSPAVSREKKFEVGAWFSALMEKRLGLPVLLAGGAQTALKFGSPRPVADLDFRAEVPHVASRAAELNDAIRRERPDATLRPFAPDAKDKRAVTGWIDGVEITIGPSATHYADVLTINGILVASDRDAVVDKAFSFAVRTGSKKQKDLFDLLWSLHRDPAASVALRDTLEELRGEAFRRTNPQGSLTTKLTTDLAEVAKTRNLLGELQARWREFGADRDDVARLTAALEDLKDVFHAGAPPHRGMILTVGNFTGDMFGLSAALLLNPKLHVTVLTGPHHPDQVGDFLRNGLETQVRARYERERARLRASQGPAARTPAPQEAELDARIAAEVAAERDRVHVLYAKNPHALYTTLARQDEALPYDSVRPPVPVNLRTRHLNHPVTRATEEVTVRWGRQNHEQAKIRTAWGLSDRPDAGAGAFLGELGVPLSGGYVVLWSRFSGKHGGAHPQHDTSVTGIRQLVAVLPSGTTVIIAGDRKGGGTDPYRELADAHENVFDLTEFWKTELWRRHFPNATRADQFKVFDHLARGDGNSLSHLGFRSGNLEPYALIGHQVRYLEEEGNLQAGRLEPWHRTVGYRRIVISKVPTLSGQWVTSTARSEGTEKPPPWRDGRPDDETSRAAKYEALRQRGIEPGDRGFATEDLGRIVEELGLPAPVPRPVPPTITPEAAAERPERRSPATVEPRSPRPATSTGDAGRHAPGRDRSARAVADFMAAPRDFLGRHQVLLRMSEGMEARAPGLGIDHRAFLKWLDRQDRHWFTLTPSATAVGGEHGVYLLTPAVERYHQEYAADAELRDIIGGRALPAVGADSEYIAAHYVPYKTGGTARPRTDVGHRVVPVGRGGEFNPDIVFTAGMNGCALAVTAGPDAGSFTVWHYQSPDSNREHAETFRRRHRPMDWFGHAEYQSLGTDAAPEITNVMWRGDQGWEFLSQEVHVAFDNMARTSLARFDHRPVCLTPGHEWSYTAKIYLRGAQERLRELTRAENDKLPLLPANIDNLNLRLAFNLLIKQAQTDVEQLGRVTGPEQFAATATRLAQDQVQTRDLVNVLLHKQGQAEVAEQKRMLLWQSVNRDVVFRRGQIRTFIEQGLKPHWGAALKREAEAAAGVPPTEADITEALLPSAPHHDAERDHGSPSVSGPVPAGSGAEPVGAVRDPRWHAARDAAAVRTVEHHWVDPVSTPRGTGAHAPRYEVRSGFDIRRFRLGAEPVTDLTVRVRLTGTDAVTEPQLEALWSRVQAGVERVFNAPRHRLPDGDRLHVTVERADADSAHPHLTVEVGAPGSATTQHQWQAAATDQDLAHEIGHQLGLRDEYQDETAQHRPDIDGSLMGNYHRSAPEGLPQGGLRDRYLRLLQSHIASADAAPQAGDQNSRHADPGPGTDPPAPGRSRRFSLAGLLGRHPAVQESESGATGHTAQNEPVAATDPMSTTDPNPGTDPNQGTAKTEPVDVEAALDRHRPPRLDDTLPPPTPLAQPVTFDDRTQLPEWLTGDATPTYGSSRPTLRGTDDVVAHIISRADIPDAEDRNRTATRLRHALRTDPRRFAGEGWESPPFQAADKTLRTLHIVTRPYPYWERFTDPAAAAKLKYGRRSQTTGGATRTLSTTRQIAPAVSFGPGVPFPAIARVGLGIGRGRGYEFTLTDQNVSQTETNSTEAVPLHLTDVHYDIRVRRHTGLRPSYRDAIPGLRRVIRWDITDLDRFSFAVHNGLTLRLTDDMKRRDVDPDRSLTPEELRLGPGSEYRLVNTESVLSVTELREDALKAVGALPGTTAYQQISDFFSSDFFERNADRLAHGPVPGPLLFRDDAERTPLGTFVVQRVVPRSGRLRSEPHDIEMNNVVQQTAKNERLLTLTNSQDITAMLGPGFSFGMGGLGARLMAVLFGRVGRSTTHGTSFGGSGARKSALKVKGAPTAVYGMEKQVVVRWTGNTKEKTYTLRAVDRMTRSEARRLAGWDDGTGLRKAAGAEPEPPVFLPKDHPTLLVLCRAESFRWPDGAYVRPGPSTGTAPADAEQADGPTLLEHFTDQVLRAVGARYPNTVAPLEEFTDPDAPRWNGRQHFVMALANTLRIINTLHRHSVAGNLEALVTTGIRIPLVEPRRLTRAQRYLWIEGTMTNRRYEGSTNEPWLKDTTAGTDKLEGSRNATRTLEGGIDLSLRASDTGGSGTVTNTGIIGAGPSAAHARTDKVGYGGSVAAETAVSAKGTSHLYWYDLELTAQVGGFTRPRALWRGLGTFGVMGLETFVRSKPPETLIGGPNAVRGQVLLSVPELEMSATRKKAGPAAESTAAPTERTGPGALSVVRRETLDSTTARALATGRETALPGTPGPDRPDQRATPDPRPFDGHHYLSIGLAAHRELGDAVNAVMAAASDNSWHFTQTNSPARAAVGRALLPQFLHSGVDVTTSGSGLRMTGLYGPGPYVDRMGTVVHRVRIVNPTLVSDAIVLDMEQQVSADFQASGALTTSWSFTLNGQLAFARAQGSGAQPVLGTYVLMGKLGVQTSTTATVTRSVSIASSQEDKNHKFLVSASAEHTLLALIESRGAGALAHRMLSGAANRWHGTRLTIPEGWLGAVTERVAHRLKLADDGLPDFPVYTERTWSLPAWSGPTPFQSFPLNALDATALLARVDDMLAARGIGDVDRERVRSLVTPRALRGLRQQLATPDAGVGTGARAAWRSLRLADITPTVHLGERTVSVRIQLIAADTVFEGLGHSVTLSDNRSTSESVDTSQSITKSRGIGISAREGIPTGDPTARTAGIGYTEAGTSAQSGTVSTATETAIGQNFSLDEPHAEFTTSYRLRITIGIAGVPPVEDNIGQLRERVPLSLTAPQAFIEPVPEPSAATAQEPTAEPAKQPSEPAAQPPAEPAAHPSAEPAREASTGTARKPSTVSEAEPSAASNQASSPDPLAPPPLPRPSRSVILRATPVEQPEVTAWRQAHPVPTGLSYDTFQPRMIVGVRNLREASEIVLATAYGKSTPKTGELTDRALDRAVAQARRTGLTVPGSAPSQARENAISDASLSGFFLDALSEEGYGVPGQTDDPLVGDVRAEHRLWARPDFSGARLMTVAPSATMSGTVKVTQGQDVSVARSGSHDTSLNAVPILVPPSTGAILPGPSGTLLNSADSESRKLGISNATTADVSYAASMAFLFAVPTDWIATAHVNQTIRDRMDKASSWALGPFGRLTPGRRATETRTYTVAWIREDAARSWGLIGDHNFPQEVSDAWQAVKNAGDAWVEADKTYWMRRRTPLSSREDTDQDTEGRTEGDEELARNREAAVQAAIEFHRVRYAADRLTRWYQLSPEQRDEVSKPSPVVFTPPPEDPKQTTEQPKFTVHEAAEGKPAVITSPEGRNYEIHDVPKDGSGFFHALDEALTHTDPARSGPHTHGTPKERAEALRGLLADRLDDPDNSDLWAFAVADTLDTFSADDLKAIGIDLGATPAGREFGATGRLSAYHALTDEERGRLAAAALRRLGTSSSKASWNQGAADLLPVLAARTFGVEVTVVDTDGRFVTFPPARLEAGQDPAPAQSVVLRLTDDHFQVALPPGTPPPARTPAASDTSTPATANPRPDGLADRPTHTTLPWAKQRGADAWRTSNDGTRLTAPDGQTYELVPPGGAGNGFWHALEQTRPEPDRRRPHEILSGQRPLPGTAPNPAMRPAPHQLAPFIDDQQTALILAQLAVGHGWTPSLTRSALAIATEAYGARITVVHEDGTTETHTPNDAPRTDITLYQRGDTYALAHPSRQPHPAAPTPAPVPDDRHDTTTQVPDENADPTNAGPPRTPPPPTLEQYLSSPEVRAVQVTQEHLSGLSLNLSPRIGSLLQLGGSAPLGQLGLSPEDTRRVVEHRPDLFPGAAALLLPEIDVPSRTRGPLTPVPEEPEEPEDTLPF